MKYKEAMYKEAGIPASLMKRLSSSPKKLKLLKLPNSTGAKTSEKIFRSVDDIQEILGKSIGSEEAAGAIREDLLKGGTGSIFLDGILAGTKKVGDRISSKSVSKSIDDKVFNLKKIMEDADLKAGSILGKNNKFFDIEKSFDAGASPEGIRNIKGVSVKKMTAPAQKFKEKALPMVGGFTIASKLYPDQEPENGGGQR